MKFKIYYIIILFVFVESAFALDIYGHRGARGLSPENTMPAYQTALAKGVSYDEPGKANGRGEEPAIAAAYVASGVP